MFPAPVCAARWDFWGLAACLFGAHSSFPPMHVDRQNKTQRDYFCMLALDLPSPQANYPAGIQQSVSAAASLLAAGGGICVVLPLRGFAGLTGRRVGGFVTCGILPLGGCPSASPPGPEEAAPKDDQRAWRGGLSPGPSTWCSVPEGGLCWRASKAEGSCYRGCLM